MLPSNISENVMSLNEMIDLSLGIGNPGEIHFHLLHQVLCAIVKNLNLGEVKVPMNLTLSKGGPVSSKEDIKQETPSFDTMTIMKKMNELEETTATLARKVDKIVQEETHYPTDLEESSSVHSLSDLNDRPLHSLGNKAAFELLAYEIEKLKKLVKKDEVTVDEDREPSEQSLNAKMNALNVRVKQCMDQIECLDSLVAEQIMTLGQNYSTLEQQVNGIDETMKETTNHESLLDTLNEKIEQMGDMIADIRNEERRLLDQEQNREMHLSCLLEQLEYLKICKVDKEDFFDALDQKMNKEELERKLSKDKFEAAYDDLKDELDETIEKLTTQEQIWQKGLIDLQCEVVTKLEKKELEAMQDYIKNKLKSIQDKIKSIKSFQKKTETAASKQQLLGNLMCLACDNQVNMRPKQLAEDYPRSHVVTSSKTMAPHIAFDLGKMRKDHRIATCRNLREIEASIQKQYSKNDSRHCGGEHTKTTPIQRVVRAGHFMEQWGPDLTTAADNRMKGDDNNVYLGYDLEELQQRKKDNFLTPEGDFHDRDRKTSTQDEKNIIRKARTRFADDGQRSSRSSACPKPSIENGVNH